MNQQEIFDKVATHLIAQGKRSIGFGGACAYRGDNGSMCAAGCLIPDDEYKPEFENRAWFYIANEVPSFSNAPDRVHDLITTLQWVHDSPCSWLSPEKLKESLRAVASRCGLSTDVLC